MMHSRESLAAEYERIGRSPGSGSAPPVLGEFTVDVTGDVAEYVERLRSVLSAATELGATADFEDESLPTDHVPEWFTVIGSESEPDFSKQGSAAYSSRTGGRPWSLQNWLYRFDPDEESRGWEWWDITQCGPSRVRIWVDSWGEPFFGCQDLLWAAYAAGAVRVDGPSIRRSEEWMEEAANGSSDVS